MLAPLMSAPLMSAPLMSAPLMSAAAPEERWSRKAAEIEEVADIWDFEGERKARQLRNMQDVGAWKRSEKLAMRRFNDTCCRLGNGAFQVGLLWKNELRPQDNKKEALRMYRSAETRMRKDKNHTRMNLFM